MPCPTWTGRSDMGGRSERSRRERRRAERPYVLIVVEGETEERYFADVKRRLRASWIKVERPSRNDPRGLVLAARRKRDALRRDGLNVRPWVVFDAEARENERARFYVEAMDQAVGWQIGVANSSPCFEYWPLLHYSPGIIVETPSQAVGELAKPGRAAGYNKPDLPNEALWESYLTGAPTKAAVQRRRALAECGDDPRLGRPVTYVDELMGSICDIAGIELPSQASA